ncbi:MAG: aminomethyltransferase family protein [Rhizobiaceae bacterium]|nr:aminomethyltransferase family protein [Rhizobiaceae bacterium]
MEATRSVPFARTEFASVTGVPPYARTNMRSRSGLKRTAFYPTIGAVATNFKLHNTYLKPDYFTDPVEEYWACRKVAGLWDVTGEEVIEISGPDALALMDSLVPRDLTRMKDGQCYYAIMCYDFGGIVEDAVLIRFSAEKFWWIGGPGNSELWIYANAQGKRVTIKSHLDTIHVASIQGPQSRDILQKVCAADLSRVPFYWSVETEVCGAPVVISRTGYTAELGYDIYVPVEHGARMFADLWDHSRPSGVKLSGSRALNLRRMEASILNFGHDFDWQHNPTQVGLGWMINEAKGDYRARDVLVRAKQAGPQTQLVGLSLPGPAVPIDGDRVLVGTRDVGFVTSATLSPELRHPIAIAFLETVAAAPGTALKIAAGETQLDATVVPMPFFDPERKLSKV